MPGPHPRPLSYKERGVHAPLSPPSLVGKGAGGLGPTARFGGLIGAVALAPGKLLMGEGATLVEFDLTQGERPVRRASLPLPGVVQDLVYADGRAYVAAGSAGVVVVDVAPTGLHLRGTATIAGIARGIVVAQDMAFVATELAGLRVVDVTDPDAPREIGGVRGSGRVIAVAAHPPYVYLADQDMTLAVADVSTPQTPTMVHTIDNGATTLDLAVDGDRLLLATTHGLHVFSLADPARPTPLGRYPAAGYYSLYSLAVAEGRVYVGHYQSGIEEFVVDAEGRPTRTCPACPTPYPDPARANVVALAAGEGRVYVADGDALRVVAGSAVLDTIHGFTLPMDVALADGYAYIAAQSQGLAVVDVRGAPQVVNRYDLGSPDDPPDARRVLVTGDYVILASGEALHRFSRTDPAHPQFLDSLALGAVTSLASDGSRLFAGSGNRVYALGLETTDLISTTTSLSQTRSLAWHNDVLYVGGAGGLRTLAWPAGVVPRLVSLVEGVNVMALAVQGSRLALAHDQGVEILSGYDVGPGQRLTQIPTARAVVALAWQGRDLFLLEAHGRVGWYSLDDPAHPTLMGEGQALAAPTALAVGGGGVLTTDLTAGLFLWRPTRATLFLPWLQNDPSPGQVGHNQTYDF